MLSLRGHRVAKAILTLNSVIGSWEKSDHQLELFLSWEQLVYRLYRPLAFYQVHFVVLLSRGTGARFSKVLKTFRGRKAIRKTPTCLFCKAGLFICCKGNISKNNCKVSCLETSSFRRYKENYVPRNTPEKFRDFRETGPWSSGEITRLTSMWTGLKSALETIYGLRLLVLYSTEGFSSGIFVFPSHKT